MFRNVRINFPEIMRMNNYAIFTMEEDDGGLNGLLFVPKTKLNFVTLMFQIFGWNIFPSLLMLPNTCLDPV